VAERKERVKITITVEDSTGVTATKSTDRGGDNPSWDAWEIYNHGANLLHELASLFGDPDTHPAQKKR
jgi:hypothetical protein